MSMLDGSALPWAVSAFDDCILSTGLAKLAITKGGHVHVGLEDYGGACQPTNLELIEQVVELAGRAGRP